MQIVSIAQPSRRAPVHPRLLLVKASTVWLWPGVALTERRDNFIRAIEPDAIRFWLGNLLGPETPNESFVDADGNPMTPRKYLAGKGNAERRRVGLIGLQALGILE